MIEAITDNKGTYLSENGLLVTTVNIHGQRLALFFVAHNLVLQLMSEIFVLMFSFGMIVALISFATSTNVIIFYVCLAHSNFGDHLLIMRSLGRLDVR